MSKKKLDEVSERGSHQGVMAEAAPFNYVNMTTILDAAKQSAEEHDGRALIVVLDHITDAGNLGAIARSAECVGASGIVIPNKRAARVTAATYKSSAGAISHIPVTQVANLVSTIERLKDEGFWVAAATEHASDLIWQSNLKGKIALVMGNEGEGVSRLVLENCDFGVKLPRWEISSLNVAQAPPPACTSGCARTGNRPQIASWPQRKKLLIVDGYNVLRSGSRYRCSRGPMRTTPTISSTPPATGSSTTW
ncbi:MAG: 23S rRNA (guanosine(2251)-2'-O)-methyltransferase RlmB [Coriobacteriaceae bacterium]